MAACHNSQTMSFPATPAITTAPNYRPDAAVTTRWRYISGWVRKSWRAWFRSNSGCQDYFADAMDTIGKMPTREEPGCWLASGAGGYLEHRWLQRAIIWKCGHWLVSSTGMLCESADYRSAEADQPDLAGWWRWEEGRCQGGRCHYLRQMPIQYTLYSAVPVCGTWRFMIIEPFSERWVEIPAYCRYPCCQACGFPSTRITVSIHPPWQQIFFPTPSPEEYLQCIRQMQSCWKRMRDIEFCGTGTADKAQGWDAHAILLKGKTAGAAGGNASERFTRCISPQRKSRLDGVLYLRS